jgi:hypothetical protein
VHLHSSIWYTPSPTPTTSAIAGNCSSSKELKSHEYQNIAS